MTTVTPAVMGARPRPTTTAPTPAPTPAPAPRHLSVTGRRNVLLAAIHQRRGVWTTGRARAFYATAVTDQHVYESTARRDLLALWREGYLDRHERSGRVSYTLRTPGGDA